MKKREYEVSYRVEDVHWWYLGHRRLYARLLDDYCPGAARGRVLDAGCGTGGFSAWLRDRYRPQRLVCLDISREALRRCGERGLGELMHGTVENIPLPDDAFDLVLSLNVIYHRRVADDLAALREMRRVLSPGGYLLLNLPALEFLRGGHDVAVEGARRYRAGVLSELLRSAGFKPVKVTYFVFSLLPAIAAYRAWSRSDTGGDAVSDLWMPPALLNCGLSALLSLEACVAARWGLPLGSSVTAIARARSRLQACVDGRSR